MKFLITGCGGFIGFHLSLYLLKNKKKVYGIDTINNYYKRELKLERLKILKKFKNFYFEKIDISNKKKLDSFFDKNNIDYIVNLAAYAGVQYSLKNPAIYFKTNEIGFYNLLENAKRKNIKKILFASSSSVAGNSNSNVFSEFDNTDSPISLYAATKKNNEILAHFYAVNYKIKIIGVRFFTVYGPYGRPDLSIFKFTQAIKNNQIIELYNNGYHFRDFTFINDAIKCLVKLINLREFHKLDRQNNAYFQIFNLGGGEKIKITTVVKILEKLLKKKAVVKKAPMRKGDIVFSRSSTKKLYRNIKYYPKTKIQNGLKLFVDWFKNAF